MTQVQNTPSSTAVTKEHISFRAFILRNKTNRRYLWIAMIGTIIQFTAFKLLYPFADFFSDSYSYIYAAYANLDINIWPIGYSKFLRVFHFITHSDTALVAFQYFFFELTALYFFFSVLYFFKPVKTNQVILFVFLFFNPLFLYVCNYVNSDPIFIALSMIWFTQLIWIIYSPMMYQVFTHAIVLFLCFTVRNNAYYYPVVTLIALLLSHHRKYVKAIGIALPAILIGVFIYQTREAAYKLTGTHMFSLFTGWQLANNALYMYEYADTVKDFTSPELKELDKISTDFYSIVPVDFRSEYLLTNPGNFFIQHPMSPLKMYLKKHYKVTNDSSQVVAWGKSSVIFGKYGNYLIKNNPAAYLWEFMIPNSKNFFLPYLEKMEVYNLESEKVDQLAVYWFNYKTNHVSSISAHLQGYILYIYPALFLITNLYFLVCIFIMIYKKKYTIADRTLNNTLLISAIFWISNFGFCVFATIVVYRYQVFPLIISATFSLILSEWLDKKAIKENNPKSATTNYQLSSAEIPNIHL